MESSTKIILAVIIIYIIWYLYIYRGGKGTSGGYGSYNRGTGGVYIEDDYWVEGMKVNLNAPSINQDPNYVTGESMYGTFQKPFIAGMTGSYRNDFPGLKFGKSGMENYGPYNQVSAKGFAPLMEASLPSLASTSMNSIETPLTNRHEASETQKRKIMKNRDIKWTSDSSISKNSPGNLEWDTDGVYGVDDLDQTVVCNKEAMQHSRVMSHGSDILSKTDYSPQYTSQYSPAQGYITY